jgi:folylpolyglutamate synthase/dihydrofolate synthase
MPQDKAHAAGRGRSPWQTAAWIDDYFSELAAGSAHVPRGVPRTGLAELLARHGNPQHGLRCIRIAGSKGKGSTALILEAILRQAGWCVGTFTSPHIEHWCERIRLAGRPVAPEVLAEVLGELAPDVAELRAGSGRGPGFFDVCLAAALTVFARSAIDIAIIEAGIGAATDATAVVAADLAILTGVEAEHLDVIGPTVEDVAREKAAVAAPGRPVVTGRLSGPAAREVAYRAQACGAAWHRLGREFDIVRESPRPPTRLLYREGDYCRPLAVAPALYWLADNTALAIAAARQLAGSAVDSHTITAALTELQLPARLECLGKAPILIADSAHTQASSALLARFLATCKQSPRVLVVAFSARHGPGVLAPELWHQADYIVVTCPDTLRGRPAVDIASEIKKLGHMVAIVEADPEAALAAGARRAGSLGLVCTAGSVYLAAHMRAHARRQAR